MRIFIGGSVLILVGMAGTYLEMSSHAFERPSSAQSLGMSMSSKTSQAFPDRPISPQEIDWSRANPEAVPWGF